MISFQCPKCRATLKAPEQKIGARSKCPKCGVAVQVPRPAAAEEVVDVLPAGRQPIEVEPLTVLPADDDMDYAGQRRIPIWLVVVVPIGLIFVCGGGLLIYKVGSSGGAGVGKDGSSNAESDSFGGSGFFGGSSRRGKLGEEMLFGDLGVEVTLLGQGGVQGRTKLDRWLDSAEAYFRVGLVFTNRNPTTRISVCGQINRARLKDEHGNSYRTVTITQEFGVPIRALCGSSTGLYYQIMPDEKVVVRSDKQQTDLILFERPVPGAQQLTMTLDAGCWESSRDVVFKINRYTNEFTNSMVWSDIPYEQWHNNIVQRRQRDQERIEERAKIARERRLHDEERRQKISEAAEKRRQEAMAESQRQIDEYRRQRQKELDDANAKRRALEEARKQRRQRQQGQQRR